MSKPKVYMETSFFRYLIAIPSTDLMKAGRQRITREWWTHFRRNYELLVSQTVYDEFYEIGSGKIGEAEAAQRFALLQQAGRLDLESGKWNWPGCCEGLVARCRAKLWRIASIWLWPQAMAAIT